MTFGEAAHAIGVTMNEYANLKNSNDKVGNVWHVLFRSSEPCTWYTLSGGVPGLNCHAWLWALNEAWCYSEIGYGGLATGPYLYEEYSVSAIQGTNLHEVIVTEPEPLGHNFTCVS